MVGRSVFSLFSASKRQLLMAARNMSRKDACLLTGFLCTKYEINSPTVCVLDDTSRSVYEYMLEFLADNNMTIFRKLLVASNIKAFALGQKTSAQSNVFYDVLHASKLFEIINYLLSMCAYFLNALFFKSSLIS